MKEKKKIRKIIYLNFIFLFIIFIVNNFIQDITLCNSLLFLLFTLKEDFIYKYTPKLTLILLIIVVLSIISVMMAVTIDLLHKYLTDF